MADGDARITRIEMPDGTEVWARISGAGEPVPPGPGPSFSDIGAGNIADRVQARVEGLHSLVTSVARSLAEPLRAVRPDTVSVEFGIELTAKAGKVIGLLADGEAKGSLNVTLTWNGGPPPLDPPPPGPPALDPPAPDVSAPDPPTTDAGASAGAPAHTGRTRADGGSGS
ncbi:CU044_2847 family protein [Streptomyces sp. NPDC058195]|uniref:CU044_2847 family protein n=1 Tax=Streptomyces sp. NPDC058195 TaxID=3346375 RepID=UPI0036EEBFEB